MTRRRAAHRAAAAAVVVACALTLGTEHGWSAAIADLLAPAGVVVPALDDRRGDVAVLLVVGSDRRDGSIDAPAPVLGERADSLMLWAVPSAGPTRILSLPRDLRVHVPGHGDGKLGGVLEYGPEALVSAVRASTGLPVHHYLELEFAALVGVVDGLGGVPITVPYPARDPSAGLDLRPGRQELDGTTALAYVRSRHYAQLIDGGWVVEEGDLGRVRRQQLLVRSLVARAASKCGLVNCVDAVIGIRNSLSLDTGIRAEEIRRLVSALRQDPASIRMSTLPTRTQRPPDDAVSPFPPAHPGSVGYRVRDEPSATQVLDSFLTGRARGGPT